MTPSGIEPATSRLRNRFIIIINMYLNLVIISSMKIVNWVLVKFKESKFCLNQSLKILNTVMLLKSEGCEWDSKLLVSSTNRKLYITLCTFIVILEQKRGESP
jgi:hypothetical protein